MMILQSLLITSLLLLDPLLLQLSVQTSHVCIRAGDIRLVDGNTVKEGKVDICYGGIWYSACDENWGSNEARVACRQLGCNDGVPILTCIQGNVRLVGGSSGLEGRVEVCNNNAWGTVCDDFWDLPDGNVVCRQLGYIQATSAPHGATYGRGTGAIVLDDLQCTGTESSLFDCTHNGVNSHNCGHGEDAGVRCSACIQGNVRLVGGSSGLEGRVEVCNNNAWGTVCDDSWDLPDGNVVCRQLGYSQATSAPHGATYGQGTGSIVLDDLQCTGTESSLFDCTHSGVNIHNCGHYEDAGVKCSETSGTGYYKHIDCLGTESSLSSCTVTDNSNCREDAIVGVRCTLETPNRPQSLRISPVSSTSLWISWTQPSITGCRDIDNYSIQCNSSSIRTTTLTTYTVTNLALTSYNYRCCVWANNNARSGSETCNSIPTPSAPTSVNTSPRSTTSVDVTWSPPSNSYIVTAYNIYYRTCYSCSSLIVQVSSTTRRKILSSLWPGTEYRVYIKAVNVAGEGAQSSTRSVATYSVPPSAPRSVTITRPTSTSLFIDWTTPQYPNGTLSAYTISCTSPTHNPVFARDRYSTNYMLTGLIVFTTYRCCVSATNSIGEGEQGCVSGKTLLAPPSVPSEFLVSSMTPRSIELSWQRPLTTHGQPYYYYLSCSRISPTYSYYWPWQYTYQTQDHTTSSHTFSDLRSRTDYSCCVRAKNTAGQSSDNCTTIRTPDAVPTAAPGNLQPNITSPTQLSISWDSPPEEQTNGIIKHYRVQICNVTYERPDCKDQNRTVDDLVIRLHPYYNYTLTVAAYTVGYGPNSSVTSIQMPEDVPGAPPRNISHEVLSSSEVKLSWEPPPLDQQNGIITGYLVYVLTVNRQTLGIHSSYNRTFIVTSLKEHTSYKFEIAAKTQIGVGPFYMYIETVTTLHGSNLALSITGALLLVVIIIAIIVSCCCFRNRLKTRKREEQHVYEEPDKALDKINNSIKLETPEGSPSPDNKQNRIDKRCQKKTEVKSSWFPKNWFKRDRNTSTGNTVRYKVDPDKVVDQQPGIPERHYLDDPDFMQDNIEEQPEIPERRYVDTISLATELSEDLPEIPSRTYLQDPEFNQELRNIENLPQTPLPGQDTEKIYQPLIPPRRYEENYQEPSSEYQSITFGGAANNDPMKPIHLPNKETQLKDHSEGQYQALTKREEASPYEPLTFGNATKSSLTKDNRPSTVDLANHSEGQYQALTKREEDSPYQPLSIVRRSET